MKIFVAGGTGFVGSRLSKRLLDKGHHVVAAARSLRQDRIGHENFTYVSADLSSPGQWQERLTDIDIAFNLAGKPIFTYWTGKAKQQIYDSRIHTTRNLVEALPADSVLISTSAVGYYGDRRDEVITEDTGAGDDFLAMVGKDWEEEALKAGEKGVRVSLARFGIVLGTGGGAMEKMIPAFKLCAGGPLGDGKQWFPWVHVDDVTGALIFLMENEELEGPFNFTAPAPVTNAEFAKTLGRVLGRPAVLKTPAFMIRLFAGEFGETLLASHRAFPERLENAGYAFQYPKLEDALREIAG